jgi:hypothetical protein
LYNPKEAWSSRRTSRSGSAKLKTNAAVRADMIHAARAVNEPPPVETSATLLILKPPLSS